MVLTNMGNPPQFRWKVNDSDVVTDVCLPRNELTTYLDTLCRLHGPHWKEARSIPSMLIYFFVPPRARAIADRRY